MIGNTSLGAGEKSSHPAPSPEGNLKRLLHERESWGMMEGLIKEHMFFIYFLMKKGFVGLLERLGLKGKAGKRIFSLVRVDQHSALI